MTRITHFEPAPSDVDTSGRVAGAIPQRLLEKLSVFPARLWSATRGISSATLQQTPAKGGFSLIEHACHLRDYEADGCLGRIQRILREPSPFLPDFEGEQLAIERNYRDQNFANAVDDFARHRRQTLDLLQALTPEQAQRTATLGTIGQVSIGRLAEIVGEHDRTHRHEIESLLKELQKA